jgi:hypothetical protein
VERVALTPTALTLEELSKLWSTLFRVPYVLSIAYRASVVLIESELTPRPSLPVRASNLYVLPISRPLVERVEAGDGADSPLVLGSTLVVHGRRLRGDATRVRVGAALATPDADDVADTEISVVLDSPPFAGGALRAGVHGAQVLHELEIGTPPAPHRGLESNVAPFVLRPTLTGTSVSGVTGSGSEPRDATVTVTAEPAIGRNQRVALLLDAVSGDEAYSFAAAARADDADPVQVPVTAVAAGDYLVRVQVDGAESVLEPDTGPFTGPTLTVP